MNLVQIQEDLKGVPIQALQAYMNGSNPEVPPFLAAGEMQRRQAMMQRQEMQQGAEQGNAPSVKEQLEQAAGLMALQQERSQQAQQQMMQQGVNAPMPATEMTPQPEPQPSPEAGIAGIPVEMGMKEGGIVYFQAGGQSEVPPAEDIPGEPTAEDAKAEAERRLKRKLDEQRAQDRGFIQKVWNELKEAGLKATAAGLDVLSLPGRAAAGIVDSTVIRPARAAGLDAGYISPKLVPEGADPESMTPYFDTMIGGEKPKRAVDEPVPVPPRNDAYARRSAGRAADVRTVPQIEIPPTPGQLGRQAAEEPGLPSALPQEPMKTPVDRGIEAERQMFEASGLGGLADRRKQMEEQFAGNEAARRRAALMEGLASAPQGFGAIAGSAAAAGRRERAEQEAQMNRMYGLESKEGTERYGSIQGLAGDIFGKPGTDKSTETERIMAQVMALKEAGRTAEAQALLDLHRSLRFAPEKPAVTRDKLVAQAMAAWDKLDVLEKSEYTESGKGQQDFVSEYIKTYESAVGGSPGTTTTGVPRAQSNLNPKSLADQIRAQLGR